MMRFGIRVKHISQSHSSDRSAKRRAAYRALIVFWYFHISRCLSNNLMISQALLVPGNTVFLGELCLAFTYVMAALTASARVHFCWNA